MSHNKHSTEDLSRGRSINKHEDVPVNHLSNKQKHKDTKTFMLSGSNLNANVGHTTEQCSRQASLGLPLRNSPTAHLRNSHFFNSYREYSTNFSRSWKGSKIPPSVMKRNLANNTNTRFQYNVQIASQYPGSNTNQGGMYYLHSINYNGQVPVNNPNVVMNKDYSLFNQEDYEKVRKTQETLPLSDCTGRKKALLIGINYFKQKGELKGCINDVKNIKEFIKLNYGFREENMRILTDDQINNLLKMPTRQNIIDSMYWLVDGAQPNDSLFFHFSGHGGQKLDEDGDEEDGYDETILPVDYVKSGEIVDDEMNAIMVRRLPPGSRLTAVFDSCHSGTALDLPYVYTHEGRLKAFNIGKVATRTLLELGKQYIKGDVQQAIEIYQNGIETLQKGDVSEKITRMTRGAMADVIMFSGCMDSQSSADTNELGYGRIGAMSHALITALNSNPRGITYLELLNALRSILKGKYTQLPQLSTGRTMDMNCLFSI